MLVARVGTPPRIHKIRGDKYLFAFGLGGDLEDGKLLKLPL